jgi:hypothetical protein
MTFTTQPMATAFGWQGDKAAHRAVSSAKSAPAQTGVEPGRVAEFEQGIKDGSHHGLRTAAVMAGTYTAIKAWSSWRGHL